MDFEFDDEQEALRETVRRFLAERAPISPHVRAALDDPVGTDRALWTGLADLGVTALLGDPGGSTGMVDAAVVVEELGRALTPSPFIASAIDAAALIGDLVDDATGAGWRAAIGDGSRVATVAFAEGPEAPVTGWVDGVGATLSGRRGGVRDGAAADHLLVPAEVEGEVVVCAVEAGAPGVDARPTPTVDGTTRFAEVTLHDAPATILGGGRSDATEALARARDLDMVASCLDGVGAAARALELALDHAKSREQFGRPIGSFQAIQHLCADMFCTVELARAAAYYACWAAERAEAPERRRAATLAFAYAAAELPGVAEDAIQILGGIGFTWEHDLHLFYKRLLTLERRHGGAPRQLDSLATIALTNAG